MTRSRARDRTLLTAALGLACALLTAGSCGRVGAAEDWPEGALLVADTRSLSQLLAQLGEIEGTPLSRGAGALRLALPDCETVVGRAPSGQLAAVGASLTCRSSAGEMAILEQVRGARDIAIALPVAGGRIVATLDVAESGDLDVEVGFPRGSGEGVLGLALPGREAPGPAVLSDSQSLIHVRVRPERGLDLAALVPADSQGARLFRLKSELFAGLVLEGVWELAVYLPEEGRPMPRAAIALGFTRRAAAVAAMDEFIGQLQEMWPVEPSFFQVGGAEGACLLDLRLLPDLAPCYVATDRALVVGWNPSSLRAAFAGRGFAEFGESGGAVVHLERFAEADRILSRSSGQPLVVPRRYPWRRLVATGNPSGRGFQLHLRFQASARRAGARTDGGAGT